jgi:uncharacterized coiled-coil DUF342 family protein
MFTKVINTVSDFANGVFSEIEAATPKIRELSSKINNLLDEKNAEHNALATEWRELNELPPGRDEGATFLNQYLDFIEQTALKKMRENFARYKASRQNLANLESVRGGAMIAFDPQNRLQMGLDAFLTEAMRSSIPHILEKIDWPINSLNNDQRLSRMAELQNQMDKLGLEINEIKERKKEFGVA